MTKKSIESRKDDKIEQESDCGHRLVEPTTHLFISNITEEQLDDITEYIHTAFERYDGTYDNVVLVCDRGIKFGGY